MVDLRDAEPPTIPGARPGEWLTMPWPPSDEMVETVARALREHRMSEAHGGTASEAYCDCACGERISIRGGTRDLAAFCADRHSARAVLAAIGGE